MQISFKEGFCGQYILKFYKLNQFVLIKKFNKYYTWLNHKLSRFLYIYCLSIIGTNKSLLFMNFTGKKGS